MSDKNTAKGEDRMRVLAVDDDSLILRAIRRLFGKETRTCERLDEALILASEYQPNVILLDATIKERDDGLEAIPSLLRSAPEAAVIVLTGHSRTDSRRRSRKLGALAYIDKMHLARLHEIVEDIISGDQRVHSVREHLH
jgi:DNA-binding NtrC family response regulator